MQNILHRCGNICGVTSMSLGEHSRSVFRPLAVEVLCGRCLSVASVFLWTLFICVLYFCGLCFSVGSVFCGHCSMALGSANTDIHAYGGCGVLIHVCLIAPGVELVTSGGPISHAHRSPTSQHNWRRKLSAARGLRRRVWGINALLYT